MSEKASTPGSPSLQSRTVATIKQAHELLTAQGTALETANEKIAAAAADDSVAFPLVDQIIDKLSSSRYDGEFLVPPEQRALYAEGYKTKEGMAQLADQLTDLLFRSKSADKTSAALGEASDASDTHVDDRTASTGFGSLRSLSVRM